MNAVCHFLEIRAKKRHKKSKTVLLGYKFDT